MEQNRQAEFEQALLSLDRTRVCGILQECHQSMPPIDMIDSIITPVFEHIGTAWENGTVALSQVYMSGRMCEEAIDTIFDTSVVRNEQTPRIGIAVLHDYHVLGKRIVYTLLHAIGYNLIDYGHGIEADALIQQTLRDKVRILLISTLMLPAALEVKKVSDGVKAVDPTVNIVVGGAPFRFDIQLWQAVGADAMGRSASDGIGIVARLSAAM